MNVVDKKKLQIQKKSQQGFSLLEVLITIGLLAVFSIFASTVVKNGFEVTTELGTKNITTQRMSRAMQRVQVDLLHSFIVSQKDSARQGDEPAKTLFRIKNSFESDLLRLTTMSYQRKLKNEKAGDLALVEYRLEKDSKNPGFTHLYRLEAVPVPDDIDTSEMKKQKVASLIKRFRVVPWDGSRWTKQGWDSSLSSHRDQMPAVVQVEIEGWVAREDRLEDVDPESIPTTELLTYVYLPYGDGFKSSKIKPGNSFIKIEEL